MTTRSEVGHPLLEVVVVSNELDVAPADPLAELERSGADRRLDELRIVLVHALFPDVLGTDQSALDVVGEDRHQRSKRLLQF